MAVESLNHTGTVQVDTQPKPHQLNNPLEDIIRQVPQVSIRTPHFLTMYSLILAESRTSQPHNPPQNGPLPFFVAGQANQPSQQLPHFPPNDPRSRTPSGSNPLASKNPYNPRPESTYDNPQELSTSQYATPTTETRLQNYPTPKPAHSHQQPPRDESYSPPVFSTSDDNLGHPHPPPQQQHQHQQQGQTGYPVHQVGAGYQAYHAPAPQQQQQQPQHKPGYPTGVGGNANEFYR